MEVERPNMSTIVWNRKKLLSNIKKIKGLVCSNGMDFSLVSKFALSYPDLVCPLLDDSEVNGFCDSNLCNISPVLKRVKNQNLSASLIKCSLSSIKYLYSDAFDKSCLSNGHELRLYISDTALLDALASLPSLPNVCVVLITENGDLKDGFYPEQILDIAKTYKQLAIKGISTNFACLSGLLPTSGKVMEFNELSHKLSETTNRPPFLSIGGTVVYDLLTGDAIKGCAQEVRMGEGVFFAYNSSAQKEIAELESCAALLKGEILETRWKNVDAVQSGGFNALGERLSASSQASCGRRRRAVWDFGVLAAMQKNLRPCDSGVFIVAQTFDFTVVDITDSAQEYKAGDYIAFYVDYGAASCLMMNSFIGKEVIDG